MSIIREVEDRMENYQEVSYVDIVQEYRVGGKIKFILINK